MCLCSESFLPQLLRNAFPIRCLVACFSYCFLSWEGQLFEGVGNELIEPGNGLDICSSQFENSFSSYFLLRYSDKNIWFRMHCFFYKDMISVVLILPNKIITLLCRGIRSWFSIIVGHRSFIFLVCSSIATQIYQSVHLFICPFI